MAIIGVDLGTTNSLATVWRNGESLLIPNSFGEYLTPSVVSVDGEHILVGKSAKERLVSHPGDTAASFKCFMGTSKHFLLGNRKFTPEELSSFVLRRLKEDAEAFLGEPVEEAVISVPAYFSDNQRFSTKQAGLLAGIHVERLINEPSAAALACRVRAEDEDMRMLVVDLGGGTLDVSVVDCFDDVVEILAVSGNNHLGGDDFNRIILDYFCRENNLKLDLLSPAKQAVLLRQVELCKWGISAKGTSGIIFENDGKTNSITMDNKKLIEIAAPLFGDISAAVQRALVDSATHISNVDKVVLVGGSCKMPVIRQYLTHILHQEPVAAGAPDFLVARGVGMYTGIKQRSGEIRDVLLTDICPFTLGTAVHKEADPQKSYMDAIIERNSTLPSSKVQRYYTVWDNQTEIAIEVFQGESMYCKDNLKLGEIEVAVPPAPRGKESVDVRFTYDINGILEVEVYNESTNTTTRKILAGLCGKLSQEFIDKRLRELSALKIHPKDIEENRLLVARAERIFTESTGNVRDSVADRLLAFRMEMERQEIHSIHKDRETFSAYLDSVENSLLAFGGLYDTFSGEGDSL